MPSILERSQKRDERGLSWLGCCIYLNSKLRWRKYVLRLHTTNSFKICNELVKYVLHCVHTVVSQTLIKSQPTCRARRIKRQIYSLNWEHWSSINGGVVTRDFVHAPGEFWLRLIITLPCLYALHLCHTAAVTLRKSLADRKVRTSCAVGGIAQVPTYLRVKHHKVCWTRGNGENKRPWEASNSPHKP